VLLRLKTATNQCLPSKASAGPAFLSAQAASDLQSLDLNLEATFERSIIFVEYRRGLVNYVFSADQRPSHFGNSPLLYLQAINSILTAY